MLPKKLEWSVLAQCDYFAVEKFVQTPDRPAMTPIQPLRECILLRKIKSGNGKRRLKSCVNRTKIWHLRLQLSMTTLEATD